MKWNNSFFYTVLLFGFVSFLLLDANASSEVSIPTDKNSINPYDAVLEAKFLPNPIGIGGEGSEFGKTIDVDGNWAVIGAPSMAGTGAVFVFEYDGNQWIKTQILRPLIGKDQDKFGWSVSISGDIIVIGNNSGIANLLDTPVYVFRFNGLHWVEEQQILPPTPIVYFNEMLFGNSVSVQDNVIIITAPWADDEGVYIYELIKSKWEMTQVLSADVLNGFGTAMSQSDNQLAIQSSGGVAIFDFEDGHYNYSASVKNSDSDLVGYISFGSSISIEDNRLLVGANRDDEGGEDAGAAYIFDFIDNEWSEIKKIIPLSTRDLVHFGFDVSLQGDRALIGTATSINSNTDYNEGAAYVYEFNGIEWGMLQKVQSEPGNPSSRYGSAVSWVGGDFLVGAYRNDYLDENTGSVFSYQDNGVQWNQNDHLISEDGSARDTLGWAVHLGNDFAIASACQDDDQGHQAGAIYVYGFNEGVWSQSYKLTASDGEKDAKFGCAIDVKEDLMVVGASGSNSVYVFELIDGHWTETQKLQANNELNLSEFGSTVGVDNNHILIQGLYAGSDRLYVFEKNDKIWAETQELSAPAFKQFGDVIEISGNKALISAYNERNSFGEFDYQGAVLMYEYNNDAWSITQKIKPQDIKRFDKFGFALKIYAEQVVISSINDHEGKFYLFNYNGTRWIENDTITSPDGNGYDFFGGSLDFIEDRIVIGASNTPVDGQYHAGAAYVFDYIDEQWLFIEKLTARDDAEFYQIFGSSVSVFDERVLVGVPWDDQNGSYSGSAYIFSSINEIIYTSGFEVQK